MIINLNIVLKRKTYFIFSKFISFIVKHVIIQNAKNIFLFICFISCALKLEMNNLYYCLLLV